MRVVNFRSIAPAMAAALATLFLCTQPLLAIAVVGGFSMSQVTWLDRDNSTPLESNSVWGYLSFAYTPDPLATNYLNVSVAQPGQSPMWLAQNVPLFRDDISGRLGIDLDLSRIGITSGTTLSSADLVFTVDPTIRLTDPFGLKTTLGVSELDWMGWDDDPVPGQPAVWPGSGAPAGTSNLTAATPAGADRDIRSQQEGNLECFLGATTRSLDWLNRTDNLSLKNAAGIYADLKALVAGQREPKKIELKAKYATDNSRGNINTKIQDTAGFFVNGIPGVRVIEPATQSLDAWLLDQFASEDIELAIYNGNWAHIVTVTRVYKNDAGKIMVRFRDDENQEDPTKGDTGPKEQQLYLKDGVWRLGGDNRKVYYGMAESVPEPAPLITMGFALLLISAVLEKRDRRIFRRPGTRKWIS